MSDPVEITVYSRENCHLCASAMETIDRVVDDTDVAVAVEEIDVDVDAQLAETYGDRVPHIVINDEDAFSYRVHAAELRTKLRAAANAVGAEPTK